jgi:hypothetical protein
MAQININFSNKTFYTILAIVIILAVAGVAVAVSQWDTTKAMFHNAGDVKVRLSDGKYYDLQTAIDSGFVITEVPACAEVIPYDSKFVGKKAVDLSPYSYCLNGEGCLFIYKIYNSNGQVIHTVHIDFNQRPPNSNTWTSIGDDAYTTAEKSGKNGDSTSSKIYYAYSNWLFDDLSGTEISSNEITYQAYSPATGASLEVCNSTAINQA